LPILNFGKFRKYKFNTTNFQNVFLQIFVFMTLDFFKYQGAGNDFIIVDNRTIKVKRDDHKTIKLLCDRRFGIGADGLMLLQNSSAYDFEMVYYNSDGFEASMCGNGGRCIVAFAHKLQLIDSTTRFIAADGPHEAIVLSSNCIRLKMTDVSDINKIDDLYFINTGVPHIVKFVENIDDIDVFNEGRKIRYDKAFAPSGTNVNFVERKTEINLIRTYERGVENETLACGTGITASAIAVAHLTNSNKSVVNCKARGGSLQVSFDSITNNSVKNIWLEGPADFVFFGKVEI
jgi:diaminopimelate epimerase